jgi:hypothetical protein
MKGSMADSLAFAYSFAALVTGLIFRFEERKMVTSTSNE